MPNLPVLSVVQLLRFNRLRFYIALLFCLGLPACQKGYTQPVRPTPLPQDDLIQVYTNHEPASSYTEPYREQTRPGDDLEQKIVDTIATARSTIDVAVQELRLPNIASALVERQKAGVKVRIILENTYSRPFSTFTPQDVAKFPEREQGRYAEFRQLVDQDQDGELSQEEIYQRDALIMLDRAKVPRIDDTADGSVGSNLMHNKFVVVDDRMVIMTSANFTTSDIHGDFKSPISQGNANNLLKIDSPALADLFTQEFNIMWGDGPGGKPNSRFGVKKPFIPAQQVTIGSTLVEVQFSPSSRSIPWSRSSNSLIGRTLSAATQSIGMALFVFSDQNLVNALEPVHQKGVEVRALIDPGFAYRTYSEGLDMLGIALADNCKYEPDNRPWQPPITTIGVPRLPPGDLLHHKFGIVDGQTVITGSHNWTTAANNGNDETVLVVHNPIVAAHFEREFDRLYTDAVLGIPPAIQKKADAQRQQCRSSQPAPMSTLALPQGNQETGKYSNGGTVPQKSQKHHKLKRIKQSPKVKQQPFNQRINLNTATQAELESLPNVGPSLAKRIIAARQQHKFKSLKDLDQISGVGPKLLRKLETRVTW